MSQATITITRGKRQAPNGTVYDTRPITIHTVLIDEREVYDGRSAAFTTAFEKGARARAAGHPQDTNPYPDHGSVTFSRAYWRHWKRGWEAADKTLATRYPPTKKGTPLANA